jgi:hypothetical protein
LAGLGTRGGSGTENRIVEERSTSGVAKNRPVVCPKIHEDVVFGRYMDPAASEENMEAFAGAKGFEKCGVPVGIGPRLATEIIIESLE